MNQTPDIAPLVGAVQRARAWFGLIVFIFAIFLIRAFYLQIIRYDYYKKAALSDQLKEYDIPAQRGVIYAYENGSAQPLVLNQKLYTLYADPTLVKDAKTVADNLVKIIGGDDSKLEQKLTTQKTRYVVLARKITPEQSKKILAFEYPGVGTQEQDYRTYPQGSLAAQLLGFVNDDGSGVYGIEQALDNQLKGKDGQLKAVTDVRGVPLAASSDNIDQQPQAGDDLTLTIDVGMQYQVEQIIKAAAQKNNSKDVSALVMDVHTGAVKAMANYPTYDPATYQTVTDPALYQNKVVSNPIETGSIMKVLTTAAALDQGVIKADTTFYDPGQWTIDGATITDVALDGPARQQSIESTLNLSLNTGATWMLMQMGGGQVNAKARSAWYSYMHDHFLLGHKTGIEQGYEAAGFVPTPQDNGAGINLTFAETSFGQAVSATALQFGAAVSSVLNGGTYYKPYLVDQVKHANGQIAKTKPVVLKDNVVSKNVSNNVISLLEQVNQGHVDEGFTYLNFGAQYSVGGKTGSAQIAQPGGGYSSDAFNGTFVGFVGGDQPQYVIVVYNIEPHIPFGFVGAQAGQPIFGDIAHMLINDYGVTPRRH